LIGAFFMGDIYELYSNCTVELKLLSLLLTFDYLLNVKDT
jgi:hypothetical protein